MSKSLQKIKDNIDHIVRTETKGSNQNHKQNISAWQKLCLTIDEHNVQQIADKFVEQLVRDKLALDNGNCVVTDCAVVCPSINSSLDKKFNIGHIIAFKIYPMDENEDKPLDIKNKWTYMRYQRLLSSLRRAYKTELQKELERRNAFKLARLNNQKKLFCTLKKKPISCAVLIPEPMPVDVAPYEDLLPFFEYMKTGKNCVLFNDEKHMEFKRGAYYPDGRIDMCKQVVGAPWIGDLMDSIKDNPNVIHFLLGNNIIDYAGAQAIANFIKNGQNNKSKIRTWYIAGNRLDSGGISLIARALKKDKYANSLWLKRNPLMPEGVKYISEMLMENKKLEILDLHNTAVLDEGCGYLFNSLKQNNTLKLLYMDANGISPKGIEHVCDYFDYLTNNNLEGISSLWIGMNRIDDEGACMLARSLKNYKYLERISLNSNRITAVGVKALSGALVDHTNLIMLDLGLYKSTSDMGELPNKMGNEGAEYISQFIENNNSVLILSVLHNNIDMDGLTKILEAFKKNKTMLYVYYDQYGLDIPHEFREEFKRVMSDKIEKNLGITLNVFLKKVLRFIKHTNEIKFIDSIYRNRM